MSVSDQVIRDYEQAEGENMKKIGKMFMMACLVIGIIGTMAGCTTETSTKTETSSFKTVDGQTEGHAEKSTDDQGSASFTVDKNHVELTNLSFDVDPSLKVMAELSEEGLIYASASVNDGDNVYETIADGKYKETITQENAADCFNDIYQAVFGVEDEEPFSADGLSVDEGVIVTPEIALTDGSLIMMAKEGSDQYVSLAYTSTDYGIQDIVDTAFEALSK